MNKWCHIPTTSVCTFISLATLNLRGISIPTQPTNDFHSTTGVRVLLESDTAEAWIQSEITPIEMKQPGDLRWSQLQSNVLIERSHTSRGKLKFNRRISSSQSILLRNANPKGSLRFRSASYRGTLKLTENNRGITITNILPLETYLMGHLGSEMNASWEMEALKAQAVASRTYALYMMGHPRNSSYDVDASTLDQVYSGVAVESDRVKMAIKETTGQVMVKNQKPIQAFYHSRCGGTTDEPEQVWRAQTNSLKRGVSCPYCQLKPYSWNISISRMDFSNLLNLDISPSDLIRLTPIGRSTSGRIFKLRVESTHRQRIISSDTLRRIIGYSKLKSARFQWRMHGPDKIVFEGIGSGHGVGMCQWGAHYLAGQGMNYKEILSHYFLGVAIKGNMP